MPINALVNFLLIGYSEYPIFYTMSIRNVILVSGRIGSGKSNTIARIYLRLCQKQSRHSFNGIDVSTPQIPSLPIESDFYAIFESINNVKIGMISAGDYKEDFLHIFRKIRNKVDVLICASRLIDNDDSVFRYITADLFNEGISVDLNFCTFPTYSDAALQNMQNSIANAIMQHLDNAYFNNQ